MTQRSLFQAQILEKLGSPLIAAAGGLQPADGQKLADSLAALMGLSAQTAVAIGKTMQLADDDPQAEPVRLALMATAARLLAVQARLTKATPGMAENQALTDALEAVLKFSESFVEAGARLESLDGQAVDATQLKLQTLYALTPVISAVAAAPLGQPLNDFLQNLVSRLLARAAEMRIALNLAADNQQTELHLLRGLCTLYAASHQDAGSGAAPETVWQSFTARAAILEILGGNLTPGAADARAPATPAAPTSEPPPAAPVAAKPIGNPANPMSFFKPGAKKPADDTPPAGGDAQG